MNAISPIGVSLPSNVAQYTPGQTRALEGHYLACINRQMGRVLQPKLALADRTKEREIMVAALSRWRTFRELKELIQAETRVTLNLMQSLRKKEGLETTGPKNERIYRMADAGSNGDIRDS